MPGTTCQYGGAGRITDPTRCGSPRTASRQSMSRISPTRRPIGHWHVLLLPHSAKFEGMARFWLSLASSYGDTLRRTPQAHLRPLSTLTDRFADTEVAFGSSTDLGPFNGDFRSCPVTGHRQSVGP